MKPNFTYSLKPALKPKSGCTWADTMVLNPAIIKDLNSNTIHMLFRSTGPYSESKMKDALNDPYPIFLGYAKSEDLGKTWVADFSRPALSPALKYEASQLYITDDIGNKVPNYSNGCIEDPRIFKIEDDLYVSAACRMFPPGPYWLDEDGGIRHTDKPEWSKNVDNPFGKIATTNDTVTVIYKLDLDKLINNDYENAFTYICNLTDGNVDDNRDAFLFPERMMIDGKLQYILLHRPHNPENFKSGKGATKPSIMIAAAENIKDFCNKKSTHKLLAVPEFDWEEERIGASWAPIKINSTEWLLPYHGKQLPGYGYTQSFMILKNEQDKFPEIIHRCSERLMYAKQKWELPDKFLCPCLFSTGGIVIDETLIMSYGAADQNVGISWVNYNELVTYIRKFDSRGDVID